MKINKMIFIAALLMLAPAAHAAANLAVTAFSCNPDEVVAINQFSCTATVQNNGDATGTLNTATLYPDGTNWLENSNYPETVNSNINSGASVEVTFDGLKGKKTGNNGFSKIMLDDVTDTYVADNSVKVNVIDVVSTVTASASSAAMSTDVTVTGQATVGGNVDVTLTFSGNSGCSIGSQSSSATTNEMTNGQTTSRTWTVTTGTSECSYSVSAAATSNPSGTASKTDTTSNTITCTNCPTPTPTPTSSSSSSSSSGGGGGGASSNATSNATANKTAEGNATGPAACKQSWDCSPWSDCLNGKRTRICVDSNDCAGKKAGGSIVTMEETQKPEEQIECSLPVPYEVEKIIKDYGIWIAAFVIIVAVLGYLYYHGHHHVRKATKLIYDYKKK